MTGMRAVTTSIIGSIGSTNSLMVEKTGPRKEDR